MIKSLNLQKGQSLSVEVVEIQLAQEILVSYRGHLFRFRNTTHLQFQIGEKLHLIVTQTNPIQLSLSGERRLYSRTI